MEIQPIKNKGINKAGLEKAARKNNKKLMLNNIAMGNNKKLNIR